MSGAPVAITESLAAMAPTMITRSAVAVRLTSLYRLHLPSCVSPKLVVDCVEDAGERASHGRPSDGHVAGKASRTIGTLDVASRRACTAYAAIRLRKPSSCGSLMRLVERA